MNPNPKANQVNSAEQAISILAVVEAQQAAELERILSHTRWHLHVVHSTAEAIQVLRAVPVSVILCEQRLPGGTWLDLARETEQSRPRPQIIVLSATGDPAVWAEVLNCGGYDLLIKPLESRELYTLVPMAWRRWHSVGADSLTSTDEVHPTLDLAKAG